MNSIRIVACFIALAIADPALASTPAPRDMLAQALKSVVQIEVGRPDGADPFAGSTLGQAVAHPRARLAAGRRTGGGGSGFIFDPAGLIATNAHVVAGAESVRVTLRDGRLLAARLVGLDPTLDLAVLRVEAGGPLPALPFGDSAAVAEGDPVWALGAPMGYGLSVTSGVLSGRDRLYGASFPIGLLQHDAALNPGNSGGPLVDAAGRLIGVNTATPPETLFDIGIGLAIPVEVAANILRQLARDGGIVRGTLGLSVVSGDADVARALGSSDLGLLVDQIQTGAAAAQAGMRPGDLLLTVDGVSVKDPRDLVRALLSSRPGQRVALRFVRDGRPESAEATLAAPPRAGAAAGQNGEPPFDLGLTFGAVREGGVLVEGVSAHGAAERYGLRAGDLLLAINGRTLADAAAAQAALATRDARVAVLRVERPGQGAMNLVLPLTLAAAAARPVGRVIDAVAGPF